MNAIQEIPMPSVVNLVQTLHQKGVEMPIALLEKIEWLDNELAHILAQNQEDLEKHFEALHLFVLQLRIEALPILLQQDLTDINQEAQYKFIFIAKEHPILAPTVQKLSYGFELMIEVLKKIEVKHGVNLSELNTIDEELVNEKIVTLLNTSKIAQQTLASSLNMEIAMLCVMVIAEKNLTLDTAMYYELEYQSAVAIKEYAAVTLEKKNTDMPWYKAPQNDYQTFLLAGPTLQESEIDYIQQKRQHLSQWK